MQPAPPTTPDAKPREIKISGRKYRIDHTTNRKKLRIAFRVARLLSRTIAELFTGGGIQIENEDGSPRLHDDGELKGKPMRIGLGDVMSNEIARNALIKMLLRQLPEADPEDLLDLVDECIIGQVSILYETAWIPLNSTETIEQFVPDPLALVGLTIEVVKVLTGPTSGGGDTSNDSSEAATPDTRADTSSPAA